MSNAHARVKHRKVINAKKPSITQLDPNTAEYKRRKEWLSSKKTLTKEQALCLEHMNQNKPILVFKEAP